MRKIKEVIVVEGRYDKKTVENVVDTVIIETSGFGIFSNKEKVRLLNKMAEKRGIIVLTDSDGAGFLIRNYLKNTVSKDKVKHAYIPDRYGKEKRKKVGSKEGKLGVEGMKKEDILNALIRCGATFEDEENTVSEREPITKADMFSLGLSGGAGSSEKRLVLQKKLDLPEKLSANALLDVLNALYSKEEFYEIISREIDHEPQPTKLQ